MWEISKQNVNFGLMSTYPLDSVAFLQSLEICNGISPKHLILMPFFSRLSIQNLFISIPLSNKLRVPV